LETVQEEEEEAEDERKDQAMSEEAPELLEMYEGDSETYTDLPKIGEKIVFGGKTGVVKYVGKTDFSQAEPMIGIELDSWSANATDGSLLGKRYFNSSPGKGYFVRKDSYASLNAMISDSQAEHILRQDSLALENFDPNKVLGVYFEQNDHVMTSEGHYGRVSFIGKVSFTTGEMVGLILDEWDPNGHNGTVRDETYFTAEEGFGWFVRVERVIEKIETRRRMEKEETGNRKTKSKKKKKKNHHTQKKKK